VRTLSGGRRLVEKRPSLNTKRCSRRAKTSYITEVIYPVYTSRAPKGLMCTRQSTRSPARASTTHIPTTAPLAAAPTTPAREAFVDRTARGCQPA
jgi:hypothetical protein